MARLGRTVNLRRPEKRGCHLSSDSSKSMASPEVKLQNVREELDATGKQLKQYKDLSSLVPIRCKVTVKPPPNLGNWTTLSCSLEVVIGVRFRSIPLKLSKASIAFNVDVNGSLKDRRVCRTFGLHTIRWRNIYLAKFTIGLRYILENSFSGTHQLATQHQNRDVIGAANPMASRNKFHLHKYIFALSTPLKLVLGS